MQTTVPPFDYAARTSLGVRATPWMKTIGQYFLIVLGPVLGRLISINPGLKLVMFLYFTFLCIAKSNILCYHYCILELTLNSESSSCVFLDKKIFLKNLA